MSRSQLHLIHFAHTTLQDERRDEEEEEEDDEKGKQSAESKRACTTQKLREGMKTKQSETKQQWLV
jgi:hypothetical protein